MSTQTAEDRLDDIFHALADRTRRAILARLVKGPAIITDLAAPMNMSFPAVSKHLRVLERARLVERTVDGRAHRCEIAPERLREVERWLQHYRAFWGGNLESLARFATKGRKRR